MSDVFTIIIRGVYNPDKNLYEAKVSCPSNYKKIKVSVVGFYIPFDSTYDYDAYIAELQCVSGLTIIDSYDNNNGLQTLAIQNIKSLNLDNQHIEFECENFNNKVLEFSLFSMYYKSVITHYNATLGRDVLFDLSWTLVLKCKGLN